MMQSVDTKEKGHQGYCGYRDTQHICLSDLTLPPSCIMFGPGARALLK